MESGGIGNIAYVVATKLFAIFLGCAGFRYYCKINKPFSPDPETLKSLNITLEDRVCKFCMKITSFKFLLLFRFRETS